MFKYLWKILAFTFRASLITASLAAVFIAAGFYQIGMSKSVASNSTVPDLKPLQLERKYQQGVRLQTGEVRSLPRFPSKSIQMNQDQKTLFRLNLALAPKAVPPLLSKIKDRLEIGIYTQTACGVASCAVNHFRVFFKDKYKIEYYGPHFRADLVGRHVMMHEVGHILQYEYIDQAEFDRFFLKFKQSPAWQDCYVQPATLAGRGETRGGKDCINQHEIFAEQFAFWATGQLNSYNIERKVFNPIASGYHIPMLMGAHDFAKMFKKAAAN